MSDNDKVIVQGGGIGLGGLLFIVFLVLKLGVGNTSVMGWSWWWVCSPLWIPVVLFFGIIIIVFILAIIIGGICNLFNK